MFSNPLDIRPKVFLGYTAKADKLISAVEENFKEEEFPINILPVDLLDISQRSTDTFSEEIKSCDFAMFVFNTNMGQNLNGRTMEFAQHVAFQLGMCMNGLGKDRVFYALPHGLADPFLESFEGILRGSYKESGLDLKKALKTFCNKGLMRMSQLGVLERTGFKHDKDEFSDLVTHYCLRIENAEGDAYIKRRMQIVANQDHVNAREHQIFSNDSPSTYETCNIKAWDENEKRMFVEKVFDTAHRKEFKVNFRHSLNKGDELIYSYKFFWPRMFPPESSDFTLKSYAKRLLVDLVLPASWDLMHIKAKGKKLDGSLHTGRITIREIGTQDEGEFIRHSYELLGFEQQTMEIRLSWVWKKIKVLK